MRGLHQDVRRCADCDDQLEPGDGRYCARCSEPVLAAKVNSREPPQYVADDWVDLHDGTEIVSEQCNDCGRVYYTIVRVGEAGALRAFRWALRCGAPGLTGLEDDGCGRLSPIHWEISHEVVF